MYSIICLLLIFLYCFGVVPPNLSPEPDARIATANLLFFYSLNFMIFYLNMIKNTAINDFISFLPMPALTIDYNGFIVSANLQYKEKFKFNRF